MSLTEVIVNKPNRMWDRKSEMAQKRSNE